MTLYMYVIRFTIDVPKNTYFECIISIAHIMFPYWYNKVRMSQVSLLNLGVEVTSLS